MDQFKKVFFARREIVKKFVQFLIWIGISVFVGGISAIALGLDFQWASSTAALALIINAIVAGWDERRDGMNS